MSAIEHAWAQRDEARDERDRLAERVKALEAERDAFAAALEIMRRTPAEADLASLRSKVHAAREKFAAWDEASEGGWNVEGEAVHFAEFRAAIDALADDSSPGPAEPQEATDEEFQAEMDRQFLASTEEVKAVRDFASRTGLDEVLAHADALIARLNAPLHAGCVKREDAERVRRAWERVDAHSWLPESDDEWVREMRAMARAVAALLPPSGPEVNT